MQYMRSFQFIMDRKNWMSNVLMGTLCVLSVMIIPIIGPLILSGYLYIVIESLHRDPEHRDYPDFDFNNFTDYLYRGIWPLLIRLIIRAVIFIPFVFIAIVVMFIAMAATAKANSPAPFILTYLFVIVGSIILGVLIAFVEWPAELQTGLSREFNFSRIFAFVKDFNKRVFKELVLSILFVVGMSIILGLIGVLALCIGAFVAAAAAAMAQHHLQFQLYELYLQRGGTPIVPAGSSPVSPPVAQPVESPSEAPDERYRPGP